MYKKNNSYMVIEMKKKVHILVYKYAGRKGPFAIKNKCEECDVTISMLKDLESKKKSISLEIKPWLDNFFTALLKGGWHAPVVLINGKIFSQGIIPNRKDLIYKIDRESE